MSSRISKSVSKKEEERRLLAESVRLSGEPAVMPCSSCFKHSRTCLMAPGSARCSECISRGRSCNGTKVASSRRLFSSLCFFWVLTRVVKTLISQEKKLEAEEESTGDDLVKLQQEMAVMQARLATTIGRLSRIRATKKRVKERRESEFRRGIQGLEGEDKLMEELSRREQEMQQELHPAFEGGFDLDSLGLGAFNFDPAALSLDPSLTASGAADESPSAGAAHG